MLGKLMSGELSSWEPITGTDMPVTIYGRQSNSGTHSFVKKKLGIEFSRDAKEMSGNAQILESVKLDRSAIGYVGAGYISAAGEGPAGGGIKILKIAGNGQAAVSPVDKSAIHSGLYYFQRPLFQFIPVKSWEKVQPFLQFEMSEAGKALIEKEGYYNIQK
jgi:phosphate transport system substrate-binding protein